jgi:hypothetical protein
MEPLLHYHHIHPDPETWDRLCAFNLYFAHGYQTAVDIYPEQAQFLLANLDKTLEEIRQQCYEDRDPA